MERHKHGRNYKCDICLFKSVQLKKVGSKALLVLNIDHIYRLEFGKKVFGVIKNNNKFTKLKSTINDTMES